jgi:hypothetical protein
MFGLRIGWKSCLKLPLDGWAVEVMQQVLTFRFLAASYDCGPSAATKMRQARLGSTVQFIR